VRRLVFFIHTSLDGYVATPNREMDWIKVDQEMFDVALSQTQRSDLAVHGRITFELMEDYWPTAADQPNATKHDIEHSAWYNSVEKVVITRTMKNVAKPKLKIIDKDVAAEIQKLKNLPGKDIVIFGSPSIGQLLTAENLIDDYWLFINPILLGHGRPLFVPFDKGLNLELKTSKTFASGVVCLHYQVKTNK